MSVPTMADHHRDAVRYPACNCGAVWRQRGNRTGHCTACHQTFEGITVFDWHQSTDDHGRTHCRDPRAIPFRHPEDITRRVYLELHDGTWRGPRMPEHVRAARAATHTATQEQERRTRQSDEQATKAPDSGPDSPEAADGPTA